MPELRRDPVVGYWTIISTERSRRPLDYKKKEAPAEQNCPFCEGKENETPHEIFAIRKPGTKPDSAGWDVRVTPSKAPILSSEHPVERFGQGLYDLMDAAGKHEIIIESPKHLADIDQLSLSEIEKVVQVYIQRINAFESDETLKYALLFKNHGYIFGQAQDVIRHMRSQLIALPITPKRVKEELLGARLYFERRDRCVFCDILRQEVADGSRIVAQNKSFIAFCPFSSRSPFETWILPKKHCPDFGKMEATQIPDFAALLKEILLRIRILLNDPPYNSILHTAPYRHGKRGLYWKTIDEDYHWYFQIAPRLTNNAGFEWGTGIHINPTPPEDAAQLLRETAITPL
jgi:UDPglucose--hexose-1-phosphate uridylyltransferase